VRISLILGLAASCLTQWHIHTDPCLSAGQVVGNDATAACLASSVNQVTQPMMHVWSRAVR
jgi:hypothetical protein